MRRVWSRYLIGALVMTGVAPTAWASCGDAPVALQVLGSGGPFGVGRASAGYLVWINGVSRIMVDAGGGTFARFHEAEARFQDLHLLALSHFHPDHSAEVPALLWLQRSSPRIAGPSGSDGYPSVSEFVTGLFESPTGVFRTIGRRIAEFDVIAVDVSTSHPAEVFSGENVTVRGIGVPHGDVPTVGYRVDVGDASIAFASDQIATNPAFADLIRGVDALVIHFAASEAPAQSSALHATPSAWGQLARDAQVGSLVLSHLTQTDPEHPGHARHSMSNLADNISHLRGHYDGPLTIAEDLLCVEVE